MLLSPFWRQRISSASNDVLAQWLTDLGQDNTREWINAVAVEAASRLSRTSP